MNLFTYFSCLFAIFQINYCLSNTFWLYKHRVKYAQCLSYFCFSNFSSWTPCIFCKFLLITLNFQNCCDFTKFLASSYFSRILPANCPSKAIASRVTYISRQDRLAGLILGLRHWMPNTYSIQLNDDPLFVEPAIVNKQLTQM